MKPVRNIFRNEKGFNMILGLVAILVLFTTFSLLKISSLDSIEPDLSRIGINFNSNSSTPLSEEQTSNPNQADREAADGGEFTIASTALDIDAEAEIESEGDNPTYIE